MQRVVALALTESGLTRGEWHKTLHSTHLSVDSGICAQRQVSDVASSAQES